MSNDVVVVTCVTNAAGMGPGHSAVAVGTLLYTFEALDYGGSGSGWKTLDRDSYFASNTHRPLLLQTLSMTAICPHLVAEYVNQSIANDDDYIGSGVCSTQAARALDYAMPSIVFEPRGFDTPYGVYQCARRLQLVVSESYLWTGRQALDRSVRMRVVDKLRSDYPHAFSHFMTEDRQLAAEAEQHQVMREEMRRAAQETRRGARF
jgi:hypothetical protein